MNDLRRGATCPVGARAQVRHRHAFSGSVLAPHTTLCPRRIDEGAVVRCHPYPRRTRATRLGVEWGLLILAPFFMAACSALGPVSTADDGSITPPSSPIPSATETLRLRLSTLAATPTANETLQPTGVAAGTVSAAVSESAHFVGETIPDCTHMNADQVFTKTWTLSNSGTAPWNTTYGLFSISENPDGAEFDSPGFIPLPLTVPPGKQVEISVDLQAPSAEGVYTQHYGLRSGDGKPILVDGGDIWVTVVVGQVSCGSQVPAGGSAYAPTLTGVTSEAGSTTVQFCMSLPDSIPSWFPFDMVLMDADKRVTADAAGILNYQAGAPQRCFWASFPADAGSGSEVSIGGIKIDASVNQEANCARAQNELKSSRPGLEFACGGRGFFYTLTKKPAGMSEDEAGQIIMDALERTIHGPWMMALN
jgi:hypothetical protein